MSGPRVLVVDDEPDFLRRIRVRHYEGMKSVTSALRLTPRLRSKRGFTLIEIVLATLLLVGGVAASTYVFSRGMYAAATIDTEMNMQALGLAEEKMEQIRGTAFASIVTETKAAVSGWSGFSRDVTVSQPSGTNSDFKQVVVTTYWNSNEGELSTSLTTTVANVSNG